MGWIILTVGWLLACVYSGTGDYAMRRDWYRVIGVAFLVVHYFVGYVLIVWIAGIPIIFRLLQSFFMATNDDRPDTLL